MAKATKATSKEKILEDLALFWLLPVGVGVAEPEAEPEPEDVPAVEETEAKVELTTAAVEETVTVAVLFM